MLLCSNLPIRCHSFSPQRYSIQTSPEDAPVSVHSVTLFKPPQQPTQKKKEKESVVPYLLKLFHASWVRFLGVGIALGHGALARVNPPRRCSPQLFRSFGLCFLQSCDVDGHDGAGVMELLTASEAGVRMLNTSSSVR